MDSLEKAGHTCRLKLKSVPLNYARAASVGPWAALLSLHHQRSAFGLFAREQCTLAVTERQEQLFFPRCPRIVAKARSQEQSH